MEIAVDSCFSIEQTSDAYLKNAYKRGRSYLPRRSQGVVEDSLIPYSTLYLVPLSRIQLIVVLIAMHKQQLLCYFFNHKMVNLIDFSKYA